MVLLLFFLQALAALVILISSLSFTMGAVRVEVRSKTRGGEHLRLLAPAIVLPVGAMLIPREKVREASRQLQPWLPAIRTATRELMRSADTDFVQVDHRREHIKIGKVGGALVIDVDDDRETVHVSVPLRAAAYACDTLAAEMQAETLATGRSSIGVEQLK